MHFGTAIFEGGGTMYSNINHYRFIFTYPENASNIFMFK